MNTFNVLKQPFTVDRKYTLIRELGVGAYGVVCACRDNELGINVAIKKINKIFDKRILAKRTLRELKLLRHLSEHENIISILDVFKPEGENYEEIYLVQELMEADMHQIIRSQQPLTDAHFQYFLYQILRGLKFIHSANVLHRDLKPGNLLVNSDCELKICDFGLARGYSDRTEPAGAMTEYVATRWYRAPEIMLSFQCYTKAIDIWSVGCIFAEMLGGKVLFPGRDYVQQLNLIIAVVGTPADDTIARIGSHRAQNYVRSLPRAQKQPFQYRYPNASPEAIDLLDKLLEFDPTKRITVEEALAHPYLAAYHDPQDEPTCKPFDFSFETCNAIADLKTMISEEVKIYRAHFTRNAVQRHMRRLNPDSANMQQDINQPAFLMIWGVYAGTYIVGNSIEAICEWQRRASFYPKFIGSSVANVTLSVAKDRAFARMFGKGAAKPLPFSSYLLFGTRDSLTILAGFSLPPLISKQILQPTFPQMNPKTADVVAQLTVPCAMQFLSTPLHLLGLHLYNFRNSTRTARILNIKKFYWGTAFARIGRIFPAYGIGGVINRQLRESLNDRYLK